MPKRLTVAELSDRLDGLALAFFVSMSAVTTALMEMHSGEDAVVEQMRDEALSRLASLDDVVQEVFTPEAIEQAFRAVMAAFVPRGEQGESEPSNDNG